MFELESRPDFYPIAFILLAAVAVYVFTHVLESVSKIFRKPPSDHPRPEGFVSYQEYREAMLEMDLDEWLARASRTPLEMKVKPASPRSSLQASLGGFCPYHNLSEVKRGTWVREVDTGDLYEVMEQPSEAQTLPLRGLRWSCKCKADRFNVAVPLPGEVWESSACALHAMKDGRILIDGKDENTFYCGEVLCCVRPVNFGKG